MASTPPTHEGDLWHPTPCQTFSEAKQWDVLESLEHGTAACTLLSQSKSQHKQGLHWFVCSTFVSLASLSKCSGFMAPTPPFCLPWATPLFCPLTAEHFLGVSRLAGAVAEEAVFLGLLLTGLVSAGVRGWRFVLRGLSLTGRSLQGFLRGVKVTGDCEPSAAAIFLLVGVKTSFKKSGIITYHNSIAFRCNKSVFCWRSSDTMIENLTVYSFISASFLSFLGSVREVRNSFAKISTWDPGGHGDN